MIRRNLALGFFLFSALMFLLMPAVFLHGFPIPALEETPFKMKSLRKFFEIAFVFFVLGLSLHPNRQNLLSSLKMKARQFAGWRGAVWVLAGIYALFFFWVQLSKHLALEINFIPFLFYDYMLWYFDQGIFCHTGFLHGFYHVNLALLLLYPFWKVFPGPWLLHGGHAILLTLAAIPLFYWARMRLKDAGLALLAAFVYLNFRYLENLVQVGFVVEVFYPLFVFLAVYAATKRNEILYYLALFLGLLVKEDSVIYFGGLGFFFLWLPAYRLRGFLTLVFAVLYALFVAKVFIPWSGSDILEGSLGNYKGLGATPAEILASLASRPWLFIQELFVPLEKVRTLFKLASRLLFLPLFSPWFAVTILAVYPLFFRSVAGDHFVQLALYYSAAVLPFLFLAFVDGWARLRERSFFRRHAFISWGVVALLIFLNGFNLRPRHFTRDDLKTIELARGLPSGSVVVTQGHLLPYLGYRRWNFYLSPHYAKNSETQKTYLNPDYYLFDFEANAYPLSPEGLREEARSLEADPRFEVLYEDHRRLLLRNQNR